MDGGYSLSTMRILALFIILILFSGAIILCYIGWVAFLGREDHFTIQEKPGSLLSHQRHPLALQPNKPLIGDGDLSFDNLNEIKRTPADPNSPENEGLPPGLISINQDVLRDPDMQRKIDLLKMRVISNLRRYILNGAKPKGHINEYNVDYARLKPKSKRLDRNQVLCKIKKLPLRLLNSNSNPVFRTFKFPDEPLLPGKEEGVKDSSAGVGFDGEIKVEPMYKKCAIIPNSGALDGARHGIDIDSHDFIIRFNNAPTAGYEDDVGSLTSLRIINSQVATKPEFGFPSRKFQKKLLRDRERDRETLNKTSKIGEEKEPSDQRVTQWELSQMNLDLVWDSTRKFLIWDPCAYTATLEEWYNKPDFPLFTKYFNLTNHGTHQDRNRFYILDCRVIWNLWELLQQHSMVKIYGNPPTSGFLGIILALQVCDRVNIYEYIPSIRESARCHYYGPKDESNPSCTYGAWHPVSAEKLFFLSISDGNDKEIFMDGVLTVPGVSTVKC